MRFVPGRPGYPPLSGRTPVPLGRPPSSRRSRPLYHAAAGRYRVVRGGGWMHLRHQLRTSERVAIDPAYANHATGFRCAADTLPDRA